ncbi:hypothetical protein BLA13014_03416 [Burkholderia aenigmatica]|jgi:hypothetical protein|uniref:Uncharacterized protein n=4 Tax=Burkholderia cepacia complex TaxID=87882 RepID=A0AAP4R9S4_9BURK|nr:MULTISPECIES: hypothetical protein [Burkholderia]HDR9758730.1 hypothetical protein [Burkholderia cepacia ATCC 25416]MBR8054799.1 hypothetical protein [Burkholderia vietnamiensis]MDN7570127.1 hypothetical protein [Burkholderia contaminans]VWB74877.1 hypothetical protein BLA13014_03416 [Burkholderia aenigmatica]HDR9794047.1 hypothetical protein [Burkholderia cepacia ATCC 25416]
MNVRAMTIAVGDASPLESPGPGEMALAATIVSGVLTMVLQLPDVSDEDIAGVQGIPHGLALMQTPDLPVGMLMLVLLTGDDRVWPLAAPIAAHVDVMRAWAEERPDSNVVLVMLVDSNTNKVRALRTIGAPMDLFDLIQTGIRSCRRFDPAEFVLRAGEIPPEDVWGKGRRWLRDDESDEFRGTGT